MKRSKKIFTGIVVVGVVGSALSFGGKFSAGSVYCFAQGTIVNQSQSCSVQAFTTHPHLKLDVNGTITSPCTGTDVAYIDIGGECLPASFNKYSTTGL